MVISLYQVCDAYKALKKYRSLSHTRRILRYQEQELRERNSLRDKGCCILCGSERPASEEEEGEWR